MQVRARERSSFKTPVGLNSVQEHSTLSDGARTPTMTTSSTMTEKPHVIEISTPKGCRDCDWRGLKLSTKWLWNRLHGLALKRS